MADVDLSDWTAADTTLVEQRLAARAGRPVADVVVTSVVTGSVVVEADIAGYTSVTAAQSARTAVQTTDFGSLGSAAVTSGELELLSGRRSKTVQGEIDLEVKCPHYMYRPIPSVRDDRPKHFQLSIFKGDNAPDCIVCAHRLACASLQSADVLSLPKELSKEISSDHS